LFQCVTSTRHNFVLGWHLSLHRIQEMSPRE
jgi:hypothetical protein